MRLFIGDNDFTEDMNWHGQTATFDPGQVIMDPESAGERIGLLTKGIAKMCLVNPDGRERLVSFMKPLSIFGEVTVLTKTKFIPDLEIKSVTPVNVIFSTLEDIELN